MATKQSNGPVKWLTIISAVILIAAGGVWYFKHGRNDAPQYQTTTVTRGDLMQAVTASGTLNPVMNVTVGCQVSGRISKLYVDFNSPVTNGQLIAEIDPRTYQAAMEQATADLANSTANLELQQAEANRALELFTNKLISQSDHDSTIATLHSAEAMVKIKTAALSNALANLGYCKVYSPVDGTVISRSVDVGQTVAASMSAPVLFQIANNLANMQIDANVSEADIGSAEEGQNVSFTVDAFPDRKFAGRVRQIRNSPTTVQNVVTYDVVIEVNNADLKLRPGMTANASLITAERSGVLKIPNAALRLRLPDSVSKGIKPAATNATTTARTGGTNGTEVAANTATPLTGNEPPEELQKRVSEMRARGEEIPPEIRTKLRELFQSGVLSRSGGGGGGFGGGPGFGGGGRGGGGGFGSRGPQSSSRTVYTLAADKKASDPTPQAVRVKTGISDGNSTEIIDGLKEGDTIIIGVILPQAAAAAPPSGGASPFGGGGMGGGGFRGGGR
jgi:HlyD family secretion protein